MNSQGNLMGLKAGSRILMHACCGPCAEWPSTLLRAERQEVTLYFYNPNIQPEAEWLRRRDAFVQFAEKHNFPYIVEGESREKEWRRFSEWSTYKSEHCAVCYRCRMMVTARKAVELGMDAFTTSLLVSPWQNHPLIFEAMDLACEKFSVPALKRDFTDGYAMGQAMAKADGLYRQKYCACIYSIRESRRFMKKICCELNLDPQSLPRRESSA